MKNYDNNSISEQNKYLGDLLKSDQDKTSGRMGYLGGIAKIAVGTAMGLALLISSGCLTAASLRLTAEEALNGKRFDSGAYNQAERVAEDAILEPSP